MKLTRPICFLAALIVCGTHAAAHLLVLNTGHNGGPRNVFRFDEATGAAQGTLLFDPGYEELEGLTIGPDGFAYFAENLFGMGRAHRVNPYASGTVTGFPYAAGPNYTIPFGMAFGPDSHLYVTSFAFPPSGVTGILRADGGALTMFVPANAIDIAFGPDGNLYTAEGTVVRRYNGTTGAPLGDFVLPGSGGLANARAMTFGPDGNLYVIDRNANRVLRYNGANGSFMNEFIPGGSGGLADPIDLAFGRDGALYVLSYSNANVLRYNGTTGGFIDVFVPFNLFGMNRPGALVFTRDVPEPAGVSLVVAIGSFCALRRRCSRQS